ncbi:hypothetical protein [Thalassotalea euphylliae]|nr:hypothetical protein [Thalassotalea euphylliae]
MNLDYKVYQPSAFPLRYAVFLLLMLIGPSFALMQLKGFHLSVVFLTVVGVLYWLRARAVDSKQAQLIVLLAVFMSLWLPMHLLSGAISARYFAYCFYFIFTLAIFYFSFRALITLNKKTLFRIIQTFIYIDLLVVLAEVFLNIAFFNYYPLAGSEYQVGSAFWSNMNTNAAVLVLLNSSLYFLNFNRAFYINSLPIMMLSLVVDAKLCFLAAAGQLVLAQLLASGVARVVFSIVMIVVAPILAFVFQKQLGYVLYTFNQALEFLANTEALEAIVSSGNMFSVAIRAYALSEMFEVVSKFSFLNWLFGIGFGNINISFVNNEWGGLIEYFAPHLFYLEMLIYAGFSYYVFYFYVMTILAGRIPWRSTLIALPSLGAIVAISSAVYFLPLYFFFAVLTFWEYEQLQKGDRNEA